MNAPQPGERWTYLTHRGPRIRVQIIGEHDQRYIVKVTSPTRRVGRYGFRYGDELVTSKNWLTR